MPAALLGRFPPISGARCPGCHIVTGHRVDAVKALRVYGHAALTTPGLV